MMEYDFKRNLEKFPDDPISDYEEAMAADWEALADDFPQMPTWMAPPIMPAYPRKRATG